MIHNILDAMKLRIKLVKKKGHEPIGAFVNPVHRTEILNRYYPYTDWGAVDGGLTEDTVIYVLGLIVCFDVNVPTDRIMMAYDPTE